LAIALSLALTSGAFAQAESPDSSMPPPAPEAQQIEVGDEEVRKFAEIFVKIEQARVETAEELSQAANPEEAEGIQGRAEDEILTTIEEEGWSVEQFNQVATAINSDPQLRQQTVAYLQEMDAN
jgi:hypothetical protein